jgi:hypothetical protein
VRKIYKVLILYYYMHVLFLFDLYIYWSWYQKSKRFKCYWQFLAYILVLLQMMLWGWDQSDRNSLWHHYGIEGWSLHEFSIDSHFIASDLTAACEASGDWHSLTSLDLFSFIHDQFLESLLYWVLSNEPFLIFLRWLGDYLRLLLCHTCNARNGRLF